MSALGSPRAHWRLTDSTSERAKALAMAGAPHGTLATADEQTAGRGRQGRTWSAAPGEALLMSVLVRELDPHHALLPLMAALAVAETAEACAPVRCEIKWPNDVWIERRKLSGILVEGRPQEGWAVVGIGVNCRVARFPEEIAEIATSLEGIAPDDFLAELLPRLAERIEQDAPEVLADWRERDALLGERIGWAGGEGTAAGVDETGALLVDTETGRVALDAGEVHLERAG